MRVVALVFVVLAITGAGPKSEHAHGGLELLLRVDKPEISVLEPLGVRYTLRNNGDGPLLGPSVIDGQVQIIVRGPEDDVARVIAREVAIDVIGVKEMLPPGYTREYTEFVFWDAARNGAVFGMPGTYQVRVRRSYRDQNGENVVLESDWVKINVSRPSTDSLEVIGGADGFATLWRRGWRRYCGEMSPEECVNHLAGFVVTNRESDYAPYVAFVVLGFDWDPVWREVPKDEMAAAAQRMRLERPKHPIVPDLTIRLARWKAARDDWEAALELVGEVERMYPSRASEARRLRGDLKRRQALAEGGK